MNDPKFVTNNVLMAVRPNTSSYYVQLTMSSLSIDCDLLTVYCRCPTSAAPGDPSSTSSPRVKASSYSSTVHSLLDFLYIVYCVSCVYTVCCFLCILVSLLLFLEWSRFPVMEICSNFLWNTFSGNNYNQYKTWLVSLIHVSLVVLLRVFSISYLPPPPGCEYQSIPHGNCPYASNTYASVDGIKPWEDSTSWF